MKKELRIVFMGTPDFAVESLKVLVENKYNIVGVITAPDKPAGRGQKLQESAVKQFATQHYLTVLQIVVAFRMLPETVWNMPKYGTFNLHASLLPQYRGAAPINWAIINGEKETGVTTFFLQHKIDTGDVIEQKKVTIGENETAGELHDKLMNIGAKLVLKTVQSIENNSIKKTPQNNHQTLKEAFKIFKPDCKIDWTQPINTIHNKIRGLSPYPTAFTELKHKENNTVLSLKIFKTVRQLTEGNHEQKVGTITTTKNSILVAVKGGFLQLLELQLEGKKRMDAPALLNGFNFNEYQLLF